LGSAGIDRFSPDQLLRTARLFASDPDLTSLIDHQSGERRWVELNSSPYLQIWLLSWPAGTGTFNAGLDTAFSVHLYAPRLTTMTRYAVTSAGLRVKGVDQAGVNW
jgi:hypothetical protein